MNDDSRMTRIQELLRRPTSIEAVRGALLEIESLSTKPGMAKKGEDWLRRAFYCLRELTSDDPETAADILVRDLLPRCLQPHPEDDEGFGHRHSYTFGEWLAELPEYYRNQVRVSGLARAIGALRGDGVRNAIRLISSIGYGDANAFRALDELVRDLADEVGDQAMSARLGLRSDLSPPARAAYLERLHKRIPTGPNLHLIRCGWAIGTIETARLVWNHWLEPIVAVEGAKRDALESFATSLVTVIAEREFSVAFTMQVWNWMLMLSRRQHHGVDDVFGSNSSLINRLDIPVVIPELVDLAIRSEDHLRYIYYLRALESERPAHMPGWDLVPRSKLDPALADAVGPTGMKGRSSTIEWHRKEAAWDVLLCRGERENLPPLEDALTGEGGYVAHRLLEMGGCLRLKPLPPCVKTLLAGAADDAMMEEQERIVAQIGAIDAAHGSGTREAFDALLGYRQLGGGVLLSLVTALTETARTQLETGDRRCVEQLLHIAEGSPREDSRGSAAGTLALLIECDELQDHEVTRAAALLYLQTTDKYARRELLFALAAMPPDAVPPAAVEFANLMIDSPSDDQTHDIQSAATVLASRRPGFRSNHCFLGKHLGLSEVNGSLVAGPSTLRGLAPHIVGRYFVAEPERFGPAIASIVRDGDSTALARVIVSIREAKANNPAVVLDALLDRLRKADRGYEYEPHVLHALAELSPARLLGDGCHAVASWLPQARMDLADTLRQLKSLTDELTQNRFELLTRLASDGVYAVRRATYRAAVECDPVRFLGLVTSWARWQEPGREGPRRYAAECACWFPLDAGAAHLGALGSDPEPGVRSAYERSRTEQRERRASVEFEARVLQVHDSEDVVRNWRYGIGLSRVGDDSTISRLTNRLGDDLHPSVRFWLKRVRKAVERRWGEVTRKWPEPWYTRPGHLERFSGVIRRKDGKEVAISGTLWLMPSETTRGLSSWGGWGEGKKSWIGEEGMLVIPGRKPVAVMIASYMLPTCEISFWGNEPYPVQDAG